MVVQRGATNVIDEHRRRMTSKKTLSHRYHEYTIRRIFGSDVDALLSLYGKTFGSTFSRGWFEWKYRDNPYVDDTAVYVAEIDGSVVGGAGFWVLNLQTGRREHRIVQPCDAAVRDAHRRRGIYTRILGVGLDRFADEGVELAFDFPNEKTRGAFQKYGWRIVETRPTYYRVQRPGELLASRFDGRVARLAGRGATSIARAYLDVRERTSSVDPSDVTVERYGRIPAETLTAVYRRQVPDALHTARDVQFYRWRFNNPQWDYTTYIGRRDGSPLVGTVVGSRTDDVGVTQLTEIVPLSLDRDGRIALDAVLAEALADHRNAALVAAPPDLVPPGVLRRYGFVSDLAPPFSWLATPTIHGVYALTENDSVEWRVDGKRLTDADNWRISFSAYDTA